jgi:hypothetical protein
MILADYTSEKSAILEGWCSKENGEPIFFRTPPLPKG